MLETPKVALVVIPHPDDGEGGCGGTVAKWVIQGSEVFFVLCTDGGKGSDDPEMTSDRLAAIREKEQLQAASTLGVKEVVLLRHPDGELEDTREFRKEIVRAIRRFRPESVLCPDPYRRDYHSHRDHRVTGIVAADAVFPYARDPLHFKELLKDEGLQPHKAAQILFWATDDPDMFVDITETIDIKIKSILCHESQISKSRDREVGESVKKRAKEAAADSGYQYAEAFRALEFRG